MSIGRYPANNKRTGLEKLSLEDIGLVYDELD